MILLVAAALFPAALLAGWLIFQAYQNERSVMERHVLETARAMGALVDAAMREREALLRGLSTSGFLQNGQFAEFRRQVESVVPSSGEWVVLSDHTNQQLLNTSQPAGTPLPGGTYLQERYEALSSGRTYFSNLTIGPATQEPVLYTAIGLRRPGGGGLGLAWVMTPETLTRSLLSHHIAEGWLVSVVDREGVIAARSRDGAKFVGQNPSAAMRTAIEAGEGLIESVTLDGVRSLTAFHRVPRTGWTVIIAAPRGSLLASAQELLWVTVGVSLLSALLAFIIAARVGRAVVDGVQTLVTSTRELSQGAAQEAKPTGINETDFVARALSEVSLKLAARRDELARARDEALAASRAKDEFLAALSHELRTPLNPVLLLSSDAARDERYPTEAREVFATIAKNAALEARLIDDLLDLTRIARGKLRLEAQPVQLHDVLRDAVATVQAELSSKRLSLQLSLGAASSRVTGDAARLQQVFWNVLSNAIKFTPAGGSITVTTEDQEGRIRARIADTGMGITEGELERIFASFTQGDHAAGGSHRFGGLGLGLAISRQLVELHSGAIRAESPGRGRGATFVVELPLAPAAPAPSVGPTPALGDQTAQPITGRRVLLVEDHAPTRAALAGLLEKRGYDPVSAASMADALRLVENERVDFVISDIGLPDGDGYQLMRTLRDRHSLVGVALSGYGSEDDVERGRQAGFQAHLTKPVTVGMLESALATLSATSTNPTIAPPVTN